MTRETAEIVLRNDKLRWSTPARLNDPYDIQFDLHLEIDAEVLKKKSLDKLWDAWYGPGPYLPAPGNMHGIMISGLRNKFPRMSREKFDAEMGEGIVEGLNNVIANLPEKQNAIRKIASSSKILCHSEVGDSLLMWTYYAEQHQGVVLRFKPLRELDSPWFASRPVNYSHQMPRLFDEEFLSDVNAGTASMEAGRIIDKIIFTKAEEWKHEREWRLNAGSGRNPEAPFEDVPFHPRELDAVIFGCVTPKADREELIDIVRRRHPQAMLLQARKDEREFKLLIGPIS